MKTEEYILIVEDSPTQALLLKHFLAPCGCQVTIAQNGEDAFARVRKSPPALIICDYLMPGINGRELCLKIRQDPGLKTIPFILITAQSDSIDGLESPEKGGPNAFLQKPIAREQLEKLLTDLLPQKKSSSTQAKTLPGSAGPLGLDEDLPVFDGRRLKENVDEDLALYNKIIGTFLGEFPQRFENLKCAFAAGNRHEVEMIAHSIKGAATTIGGERLRVAAQVIEKAASSAGLNDLRLMLPPFLHEFERLQAALKSEMAAAMKLKEQQNH